MKPLTIEEVEAMSPRSRKNGYAATAAKHVREFVESGFEAAELEPQDFGRSEKFSESLLGYLREVLKKQIVALKLEKLVRPETHGGRLILVRVDI